MDLPTRKSHLDHQTNCFLLSGALAGKGGKWNDKTLDKWLKSPADYAPGKLSFSNKSDAKIKSNLRVCLSE